MFDANDAEEDDAEGPVRQGRPGGAAPGREDAVTVDDRVLDLLQRDRGVYAVHLALGSAVGRGRHPHMVGEADERQPPA